MSEHIEIITMVNDLSVGSDGWAQIAPLGDYPGMVVIPDGRGGYKKEKAVQRLDAESVASMVNEYKQSARGITGFFKKRPLFEGHPDAPVGAHLYPNKSPVGVFLNIDGRNGLCGEPALTDAGEQLIASKTYRALSGRWEAEDTGQKTAEGLRIYRPVKFLSAGLTNNPNLPVQMLNEAEPTENKTQNPSMKKIIAWLGTHGITIANDATEDQVETALAQLDPKLTSAATVATLTNERDTLKTEKTTLTTERDTLRTTNTTLTNERDTLRTSFANERGQRVKRELDLALTSGRITAAERPTWESRLGNEATFANELSALQSLRPTVKTESQVLQLDIAGRKVTVANEGERRTAVSELVTSIALRMGLKLHEGDNYTRCYNQAAKECPALFAAMKRPGDEA